MKKYLLVLFIFISTLSNAQLTGIKTIPGDYATITAAVTALNTSGVGAGGVTFNIASGHTETGNKTITATGTAANPIIFQKSGVGANPTLTAGVGTGWDAIFKMVGTDYITFDGLTLQENPANNSGNYIQKTEYGFAFLKSNSTNGCQHNTIKNCTISLDRMFYEIDPASNGHMAIGIYFYNRDAANNWINTESSATGTHSYNTITNNTIINVGMGIQVYGYHNTSSGMAVIERENVITNNIISNVGGFNGIAIGISIEYAANSTITGNQVTTHVTHQSGCTGILYRPYGLSGVLLNNNTIQVNSTQVNSYTTVQFGITVAGGSGEAADAGWKTIEIKNNTILAASANRGYTGINCQYNLAEFCVIENNDISLTNNTTYDGTSYGIQVQNWWSHVTNLTVKSNTVKNHLSPLAQLYAISCEDNTDVCNIENNKIINNNGTIVKGIFMFGETGSVAQKNLIDCGSTNTVNQFTGIQITGINNSAINNLVSCRSSSSGATVHFGIASSIYSTTGNKVNNNTVYLDGGSVAGPNYTTCFSLHSSGLLTEVQNNIFINKMLPGNTTPGYVSAFFNYHDVTLSNFISKNNIFYTGIPSSRTGIYSYGSGINIPSVMDSTLMLYKLRVCAKDVDSKSGDISFLSFDNSNSGFLHINPTIPSLANNNGVPIASVTNDYDAESRNATTPDIGADEFNGITAPPTSMQTTPVLWLKADAGVFTDAGVTAATNGQTVQQWNDQSCNGFNASQPTASKRPTWQQNAFNGKPALWFDGTNGNYWLENTVNTPVATAGSARTYFVVAKAACSATGTYYPGGHLFCNRRTPNASTLEFVKNGSGIFHGGNLCCNHPQVTNVSFESGQEKPFIGTWRTGGTGTNLDFWFNGTSATTANANFVNDDGGVGYVVGDRRDAFQFDDPNGRYDWQGHIAEIIVYDRALTDGERQSIETYLYNKYQIGNPSLPSACNVKLWLKADTAVFTDAGVTAATNGQSVQQWNDQSSNAYHVTQTNVANKPTWQQYAFNGKPALFFDGANGKYFLNNITNNPVAAGAARTVFVAGKRDCNTHAGGAVGGTLITFRRTPLINSLTYGANSYGTPVYIYTDANGVGNNNASIAASTIDTALNQFVITYQVPAAGSQIGCYLNGLAQTVNQGSGAVVTETGSNGFTIGDREDQPDLDWSGWISEVIVYDRALTTTERQSVEAYLQTKYNTTGLPPVFNNIPAATTSSNSNQADASWQHTYNTSDNSKVIVSIKDNCLALGTINSTVYADATAGIYAGMRYMRRHFVVNPTTDPVGTKRVRLYYTNADFADLQTYIPTLTSASQLVVTKYDGTNEDGVFDPSGGTVQLIPSSQITTGSVFGVNYLEFDVTGFSEFWIHTGFTALPLKFLSFSAQKCNTNQVCLNWKTANEQNVSHFEIERSTDGVTFNKVGTKAANNLAQNVYTTIDDISALQTKQLYYRIKQVDISGKTTNSSVQLIKLQNSEQITIYPNPVANEINITNWSKIQQVQLIDVAGKVVKLWQNINSSTLNVNEITAGVYLIKMKLISGEIVTQKIIKQ